MSPWKKIGVATLLAMLVAAGWQYRQGHLRSQEATRLRVANSQLRLQASQRHEALRAAASLAGTSILPRAVTPEGVGPPTGADASAAAPGPARTSERVSNYRNEGQSTPHAALQTLAWACDQGDAGLMEKLLVFDATARRKTEAHFASLPPEARPPMTTLEALAAALYISDGMQHPYPVSAVLERARFEPVNSTRLVLRLPGANGDGYEFQHTAEGWKVAITEAVVDDYIQQAASAPAAP